MRRKLLLLGVIALGATASPQAQACSSTSEYVAPSNFELVEMAEAVGVYTPVRGSPSEDLPFGEVVVRLVRSVAGSPPPELTLGFAQITERDGSISPDDELSAPFRFHDYGGGCSRSNYDRGSQYLLILHRDPARGWEPVGVGGSRAKELYQDGSPWARTVERYLTLAQLDPPVGAAALAALRDDRSLTPPERADIDNHLRTPSQWKPTEWLVGRYERLASGAPVDILTSGPIQWRLGNDPRAILLTSLLNGDHPAALPLFERLLDSPVLPPRERGLALLYFARHGRYARAYEWIERNLETELSRLQPGGIVALLEIVGSVNDGDSGTGPERWRSDPRAAATWPALAARLEALQRERLPEDEVVLFYAGDDDAP